MTHNDTDPIQDPDVIGLPRLQWSDNPAAMPTVEPAVAVVPGTLPSSVRSESRVREPAWNLHRLSWQVRKRDNSWREVCRPGDSPPGRLLGLMLFGAFFVWIILLVGRPAHDVTVPPKPSPATRGVVPSPRSAAVLMGRVAPSGVAVEQGHPSEAEEDSITAMAAGAWQLDTDFRLSQLDMQRVWNLNNRWRPPLDEFQDTLIGLASLTTLGGSWVGHEICRNELALESELIAPHALALSDGDPGEDPTASANQLLRAARAAQWEALWRRIQQSADAQVRGSDDLEDFWKGQLDEVLEDVRRAHQALLPQFCDLADESAAQAVIRYYDQYFTAHFPTSTPDGAEQE